MIETIFNFWLTVLRESSRILITRISSWLSPTISLLKVMTSIGNAPISKNEMEALITNHVKEYVLTNT